MPPKSSAIDDAIVAVLNADAALRALMPDGVYLESAPPGVDQFVKVAVVEPFDLDVFGGRAQESVLYAVTAVGLSRVTDNATAAAAADRIEALLGDGAPFPVAGYVFSTCYRDEPGRIVYDTPNQTDKALRWLHRGAHYRLIVAWPDAAALETGAEDHVDQNGTLRES